MGDGVDPLGDIEDGEDIVVFIRASGSNFLWSPRREGYDFLGRENGGFRDIAEGGEFGLRSFLRKFRGELFGDGEALLDDSLAVVVIVEGVDLDGVEAFGEVEGEMGNDGFALLVNLDEIEGEVKFEAIEGFSVEAGGGGSGMYKVDLNVFHIIVGIGWCLRYSVDELIVFRFGISDGDDSFEGQGSYSCGAIPNRVVSVLRGGGFCGNLSFWARFFRGFLQV